MRSSGVVVGEDGLARCPWAAAEPMLRDDDADLARLMGDAGIVRNRAKITAARTNARATLALRERGGLDALVWSHRPDQTAAPRTLAEVPASTPASRALAAALRAHGFAFVGPTTSFALMQAAGLVDSHLAGCHRRGACEP